LSRKRRSIARRAFLRQAGLTTAGALVTTAALSDDERGHPAVAILIDPGDEVARAGPARWALEQLKGVLAARNWADRTAAIDRDIEIMEGRSVTVSLDSTGPDDRSPLYPGFNATWSNQPYFVVRPAPRSRPARRQP
jgi:hypothetical protein